MPSRNLKMIRRDINRLNDLVEREKGNHKVLSAMSQLVSETANNVNTTWQDYQAVSIQGDEERQDRKEALYILVKWTRQWRATLMMFVPAANLNIHKIPSTNPTPDDYIRAAGDVVKLINKNKNAESIRQDAMDDLGDKLENAKKEVAEASAVLPEETNARDNFTETSLAANSILIRGLEVVRSIFGPTSPEYKQFIARSRSSSEDEDDDTEAEGGQEGEDAAID
jgi:hypothetical protein